MTSGIGATELYDSSSSETTLSTTTGVSISFNVTIDAGNTDATYFQWARLIGVDFGSTDYTPGDVDGYAILTTQLGTADTTSSTAQGTVSLGLNGAIFGDSKTSSTSGTLTGGVEYNIILTISGSTWTVSAYTADSTTAVFSTSATIASAYTSEYTGNLSELFLGDASSDSVNLKSAVTVNDIAVYDGVLSEDEMSTLSNNTLVYNTISTEAVPEPSTATLSLFALAGLCVRRRRK